MQTLHELLQFLADCWLPMLTALALGILLYHLGRLNERRRQRRIWAARLRQHNANSILRHL